MIIGAKSLVYASCESDRNERRGEFRCGRRGALS